MDDLPPPLLLEILSRLTDSTDLARSRLVSKSFNALSRDVRSINLVCSLTRYVKSRSPETRHLSTPFKAIFNSLVANSSSLESVSIGVSKALCGISYDDIEDESADLYLTDAAFVSDWLPKVSGGLKSLSITDFWIQSCWRRSEILALLSSFCRHLVDLEVKNAWLSVEGLNPMPLLTSLTLESIRLDDEDLSKVNQCFPCLQVLNLIGVGGLKEPKINLHLLRMCRWTVSNAPISLTILAPNLLKLELKCIDPRSLVLETPSLSSFYLSLRRAYKLEVKNLANLKVLELESSILFTVLYRFPLDNSVQRLTVDCLKFTEPDAIRELSSLEMLFDSFPKLSFLYLRSGAWSEMETRFLKCGLRSEAGMKGVKEIIAQLVIHDVEETISFVFVILDKCTNLSDVGLLIHREVDMDIAHKLISRCTAEHPKVRWNFGMWEEGCKDEWISDGI